MRQLNRFERLAQSKPGDLVDMVRSGSLDALDLTFATAAMGDLEDVVLVRSLLLPLLHHKQAVVREGVLIGLGHHPMTPEVKEELFRVAMKDPIPEVRNLALALLDGLEEE